MSAFGGKAVARREDAWSRAQHVLPLLVAGWLLFSKHVPASVLTERFLPEAPWLPWAGAMLTALGLGFAVWARVFLGRNWSGIVTLKQDHELIDRGPYAIVRHPIYTGLILAFGGTALAFGQWRGALGLVIVIVVLWRKLKVEERFMVEAFGERYRAYRRRVPALLPFAGGDEGPTASR